MYKNFFFTISLLLCFLTCALTLPYDDVEGMERGLADATINGTVVNGTQGMQVIIKTIKMPSGDPPPPSYFIYFNTTTDPSGSFSRTVDSRDTSSEPAYVLDAYQVEVRPTYYLGLSNSTHIFTELIDPGQTFTVPDGGLEAYPEKVGNLTVRILNGSSREALKGAVVTVDHVPDMPDIPFSQVGITDSTGEISFTNIRSVETEIEASKIHFRPLSTTEDENTVIINAGGTTVVEFNLTEDPWPFTTTPSDGEISGNVTNGILINFGREMDHDSINRSSNYLFEKISGDTVPFDILIPGSSNDRVRLVLEKPLDYDSDYHLSIYATIRSFGGGSPLWRTMDVYFHTESPPSSLHGRVVDSGERPARNVVLRLVDQTAVTGTDGIFDFPLVIPGTHDLIIEEGYIYLGATMENIVVSRGEDIDVGNISVSSRPYGSLNVTVTSRGTPLYGAWVKIISNDLSNDQYNLTTDENGLVSFDMVRSGTVNLKIGAPHHSQKIDVVSVTEGDHAQTIVDLMEDPLPVTVDITEESSPGVASVNSDFIITPFEPIDFRTLNVTLWKLNDTGARDITIETLQPQYDSLTGSYLIKVKGKLPLMMNFQLVIDDELRTADGERAILWRDLVFSFSTASIPDSFITGVLLLEEKALAGVELVFNGQTGSTSESGEFNLTISMESVSFLGYLEANLTDRGYGLYRESISLNSGSVFDVGRISLKPIEDWYSVHPADGAQYVDPETDIILTFSSEVMDQGNWSDRIKIIRQNTSAPITGSFDLNDNNRTLVFEPDNRLMENMIYTVEVTNQLLQKNGKKMFPVGNTTTFKVRPVMIEVELVEPVGITEEPIDLDEAIIISFGVSVDKGLIESSMVLEPTVNEISFLWRSASEVRISPLFSSETTYVLSLPPGVYGLREEVLNLPFRIEFETGTSYGIDHSFSSLNVIPDPETGWETGQEISFSGTVLSSQGYLITVTIGDEAYTTTVTENGTWSLKITLPAESFSGTMLVSMGTPGGPPAHSVEFQIDIREPSSISGDNGEQDNRALLIIGVIVILVILILAAGFYMVSKKKNLEGSEVEITEVDADWSDDEE